MVFLNGRIVTNEEASVSIFDRSFLYGDGLFETVRVRNGHPFRSPSHLQRLREGAEFLRIRVPLSDFELTAGMAALIGSTGIQDGVLRITLSRGVGPRGYSPRGAEQPMLAMTLNCGSVGDPKQLSQWRLTTASVRVAAGDPLGRFKTCNKLHQVLARAEAETNGADEALLLNTDGDVAEAASSNVFWIEKGTVFTPPLQSPALPGVTRALIIELCSHLQVESAERRCHPSALKEADGVFLTLSSQGIVEACSIDDCALSRSPTTRRLHEAYGDTLWRETGCKAAES